MKRAIVFLCVLLNADTTFSQTTDYYPIDFLSKYSGFYESALEELGENDTGFVISGTIFKGRSVVVYLNEIAEITAHEMELIQAWQATHRIEDMSELYKRKILVQENENRFWVLMNDKQIEYLEAGEAILIYYYYVGGVDRLVGFLSIGFED